MDPDLRRILETARLRLTARHFSPRTREVYLNWIRRYGEWCRQRSLNPVDPANPGRFTEWLADARRVAPSTQNQAGSALGFLFTNVLGLETPLEIPRPRGRRRLPAVLSREEVRAVLARLHGVHRLAGSLLYGSGLRLGECMQLRVKDISLDPPQITVRHGKGGKDRMTLLAAFTIKALSRQVERVSQLHRSDRARGGGWAPLPGAFHRKAPRDGWELAWQFLFPGNVWVTDPATGRRGRHHIHPSAFQRAFKQAVRASGVPKRATPHTLRHSFATHALGAGMDIRILKDLLGHKDINTTMIYLHISERANLNLRSPLDDLMNSG